MTEYETDVHWADGWAPAAAAREAGLRRAVERMCEAVTRARFVGTDPAADEVVLSRILSVSFTFRFLSPSFACIY